MAFGVKETTEVVMFAGSALQFLKSAYADKKIDGKDFFAALPALAQLELALEHFDQVGKELDDLNEAEKSYLKVLSDQALGNGAYQAIGEDLIIAAKALARAYGKIKSL